MIRKYLLGLLLFIPVLSAYAQQGEQRARELFDFLIAGQGDSVYVWLNDDLKEKLNPGMFMDTFDTLGKQVGKLQVRGVWKEDIVSGTTIHYRDMQFERASLRFITAFDGDGKVNTIRFVPVVADPYDIDYPKMNEEKIEEQDIEIVCGEYKLPGTLTLPKGIQHVPVIIWVHGSGPNDRDESVGPNKPFRDLAWGMAERGIASIRYDKRTMIYREDYAPEGKDNYDSETVDDALVAIELAKTIGRVNTEQIYIAGHSLGAMLAPRITERSKGLAGIIMLAGNARPLEDLLPEQVAYILSLQGGDPESPEKKAEVEKWEKQAANVKKLGTDAYDETIGIPFNTPPAYWEFSNTYKQVEVAKRSTLPMLILQGERDYQVTMEDFELWRANLSDKSNVSFKSYPALSHLFHEGSGKSTPAEYNIQGNIPDYVMDDISGWIKDKTSLK